MNIRQITGNNLRRIRQQFNYSLEELAAFLGEGFSKQRLSTMERGIRGLSADVIQRICDVFSIFPTELFRVQTDDPICDLLMDEIHKMDKAKKAALYSYAVSINQGATP